MKQLWAIACLCLCVGHKVHAQGCCSGSGNNPLAGMGPTGVLAKGQIELGYSSIFTETSNFYEGAKKVDPYFDKLTGHHSLLRTEVGLSDRLTLSTTIGYFQHRTIYEFEKDEASEPEKVRSSGFSDLTILPRYKVWSHKKNGRNQELNIGLGFKVPLRQPIDSNFVGMSYFINRSGPAPFLDSTEIWQLSPPLVQTTTGSHDLVASLFYLKSLRYGMTVSVNGFYMNRGWNSNGVKFGDFGSLGLILGKSIGARLNASLQCRYEWVDKMKTIKGVDFLSEYNIDKHSTGSSSLYISSQLNYSYLNFRAFAMAGIPVYQKVEGVQSGMPNQFTLGGAYMFNSKSQPKASQRQYDGLISVDLGDHVTDTTFKVFGNCGMCKSTIETTLSGMEGITYADYNVDDQALHVAFNSLTINLNEIKSALAEVGYDSDSHKATDEAYEQLHSCCKYEREP